jgi:hypothetical protein
VSDVLGTRWPCGGAKAAFGTLVSHILCAGVVKKMTASIELSFAKETSTMNLSIVRRGVGGGHSARPSGNSCSARH